MAAASPGATSVALASRSWGGACSCKQAVRSKSRPVTPDKPPLLSRLDKPPLLSRLFSWASVAAQGNAALKSGDFATAIDRYTAALEVCVPSSRHVLLSNRSAAHLKMATSDPKVAAANLSAAARDAAEKAAADARDVTRMQPDFVKGYFRLGHSL